MKQFNYTITDEQGIHARPAGILVKEVKKYASKITIKKGTEITVSVDGADEVEAAPAIEAFFKENL